MIERPGYDGLIVRDANSWAHDKLDIVECYLEGFSNACKTAVSHVVVDGFAGPGVNRFDDGGRRYGTPLIALNTTPLITRVLATDLDEANVVALQERCREFGGRALIRQGDVNVDLAPLIQQHVHARSPCLVVLDPEGTELAFDTVRAISTARGDKRPELLILLATHMGFFRLLWQRGLPDWVPPKMDSMYGCEDWREIYERRRREELDPSEATTEYVRLYAQQLRSLGYAHVGDREIRSSGRQGRIGYFLLFAGDHPVGIEIMEHCMNTRFAEELTLFPTERPKRI